MSATRTATATIPSGSTTSGSVDLSNYGPDSGLVGMVMPSTFTGASISFNVSLDDATYQPLFASGGSVLSINITAGKTYSFSQDVRSELAPYRFVQVVSASSEGASRSIGFLVK